jgi:hypothetical protein
LVFVVRQHLHGKVGVEAKRATVKALTLASFPLCRRKLKIVVKSWLNSLIYIVIDGGGDCQ